MTDVHTSVGDTGRHSLLEPVHSSLQLYVPERTGLVSDIADVLVYNWVTGRYLRCAVNSGALTSVTLHIAVNPNTDNINERIAGVEAGLLRLQKTEDRREDAVAFPMGLPFQQWTFNLQGPDLRSAVQDVAAFQKHGGVLMRTFEASTRDGIRVDNQAGLRIRMELLALDQDEERRVQRLGQDLRRWSKENGFLFSVYRPVEADFDAELAHL